jgi:hypothetical protein
MHICPPFGCDPIVSFLWRYRLLTWGGGKPEREQCEGRSAGDEVGVRVEDDFEGSGRRSSTLGDKIHRRIKK